jgi:hypothetical protein
MEFVPNKASKGVNNLTETMKHEVLPNELITSAMGQAYRAAKNSSRGQDLVLAPLYSEDDHLSLTGQAGVLQLTQTIST